MMPNFKLMGLSIAFAIAFSGGSGVGAEDVCTSKGKFKCKVRNKFKGAFKGKFKSKFRNEF